MIERVVIAGLLALKDYIATHVLTCLIPAFLLAGGMVTFIDREGILDHLGGSANKLKSFSLASVGGVVLAACSCTAIPVAGGLYFSGAGIGVAFILLWTIPAINILALIYTGTLLGTEMMLSRVVAVLLLAFAVGWVMTVCFRKEPEKTAAPKPDREKSTLISGLHLTLLLLILASLLLPNYLVREGTYLQKVLVWGAATTVTFAFALFILPMQKISDWLRESWWFVRVIFPLLFAGVFLVGVVGEAIPEDWIKGLVGGNHLGDTAIATMIGAITYFATLTEAPFVDTMMGLGMAKGPALALLLAGPGLSLPNWLVTAKVFGIRPALVYVPTIVILSALAGWLFGILVFG